MEKYPGRTRVSESVWETVWGERLHKPRFPNSSKVSLFLAAEETRLSEHVIPITKIIKHQNSLSVWKEKDISINLFFYSKIFNDTNILQQSNLSFKEPLTFMLLQSDSSPSAPTDVPSTPGWQATFVLQTLQYYFLIPHSFFT